MRWNPQRDGLLAIALVAGSVLTAKGASSENVSFARGTSRSPQSVSRQEHHKSTHQDADTNLYWGDLHLHTRNSPDAFLLGNENLSAEDAFRFARGERVLAHNGEWAKLHRPLDFLAVTDHGEYLGAYVQLKARNPELLDSPIGQRWLKLSKESRSKEYLKGGMGRETLNSIDNPDPRLRLPKKLNRSIWEDVCRTADRFNDPGLFTAFIGYEWTSQISGDNLHRVILIKDGADKASRVLPFTAQDSTDPELLWGFLARYERQTGGEVLAIPHNGNLSNGRMFAANTLRGGPFDAAYARKRARWEPVFEVTQLKGDSETHPRLSPMDEFANFERWDEGNIILSKLKEPWMLQYEYARAALREGLTHDAKLGVNPFKFGLVGGTDSHTSLSTQSEDNFWGKFPESEPSPSRIQDRLAGQLQEGWKLNAAGLTGVWARENTREALFAAIKRREVYATTGSRIEVRFFGGWDFEPGDSARSDYVSIGYGKGVPMGGDLVQTPGRGAPKFLIAASKDPNGANLDRIQIVKGWLDAQGESHEAIYDVALSDGRKIDPQTGKAPPVGSTVNVADASYSNSIGAPDLAAVWADPAFQPEERAFYYARVLELPVPRWTAYDAKRFKIDVPNDVPMTVQDRAYTSPVWYHP